MSWPKEGEAVQCDVCRRKVFWVGRSGVTYTVLDGPPNEREALLVCSECEVLMDHFGFSTYALKRFLELEKRVGGVA